MNEVLAWTVLSAALGVVVSLFLPLVWKKDGTIQQKDTVIAVKDAVIQEKDALIDVLREQLEDARRRNQLLAERAPVTKAVKEHSHPNRRRPLQR